MRMIAAILMLLALLVSPAMAGQRVALVIGNGAYQSVAPLANPRADAEAMAAALRELGFEVELGLDLDLQGMRQAARAFADDLPGADVALFFYAGHGMQVYGQNYLLPVDATLKSATDLDFEAFSAELILSQMERWPAVKIVMLDACRNNPFAVRLSRSMGSSRAASALSRGLAPIEAAGGMLVAYATDPGDVAADGEGGHSPFTAALLANISAPGVEINTMLARVRADVYRATNGQQRPWTETSLIGEFYMAAKPVIPPAETASAPPLTSLPALDGLDPRRIELALWQAAEKKGMVADYQEYLRQYPEGIFAQIAKNRIAALEKAEADGKGTDTGATNAVEATGSGVTGAAAADASQEEDPTSSSQPGIAVQNDRREVVTRQEANGATDTAATPLPDSDDSDIRLAAVPDAAKPVEADADSSAAPMEAAAAAEALLGLDRDARREVQARLRLAGHDPQGIDGIFGPNTRRALSAWQAAAGLVATGYLDAAGLARLERATEAEYVAWVARQQREAEAARQAAVRARAAQRRAEERQDVAAPAPGPAEAAAAPAQPPTNSADKLAAPPEGWQRHCYFVMSGSPQLERRCELVRTPVLDQHSGGW